MAGLAVPELGKKIDLLIRYSPRVYNQSGLADAMGLHRSNIGHWIKGKDGSTAPNTLPSRHVDKFCRLFEIEVDWLLLPHADQLEQLLRRRYERLNYWEELVQSAVISESLAVEPAPSESTRLDYPDQPANWAKEIPTFVLGQRVRIRLGLPSDWSPEQDRKDIFVHVVHRVEQSAEYVLCPSNHPDSPNYRVDDQTNEILVPSTAAALRVSEPAGRQSVIAIITDAAADPVVVESLCSKELDIVYAGLNEFARSLRENAETARRVYRRSFNVVV